MMPNAKIMPIASKPQFQKSSKMGLNHSAMPVSVVVTEGVLKYIPKIKLRDARSPQRGAG